MASQIEMITAFTSEYMQESPDGCQISQTYLSLLSCLQFIQNLNIEEHSQFGSTEYMDINDYNNIDSNTTFTKSPNMSSNKKQVDSKIFSDNILDQSITGVGLNNLIEDNARVQKRKENKIIKKMRVDSKMQGRQPSKRSVNYDSDPEKSPGRTASAFSQNSFFQE